MRNDLTIPSNFTVEEWVSQANIGLMRHPEWCAFSCVLAAGTLTVDASLPTAATDGWNVRINPEFARSLKLSELRFVLVHEALHNAMRHLHVWRKCWDMNAKLTNVAADHYVNLAISDADAGAGFVTMPAIGIQPDAKYRGMSVGQIFEALQQAPQSEQSQSQGDDGEGMDSHEWEDAQSGSEAQQQARSVAVQQALRQGEIVRQKLEEKAGKGGGSGVSAFDLLSPRVDWREQLREFMRETVRSCDESSWRRPNRRFLATDDTYMPSIDGQAPGELVVGIDTSGSVFGGPAMSRFVTEVQSMISTLRPQVTHLIWWDSDVAGHQRFTAGEFDVTALKPAGGGGTDASVLFDYLRDKRITPAAVLQFTDGLVGSSWGRADCPVLWAITTPRITAPFGRTITLDI